MSDTLVRIQMLVGRGDIATSVHRFRELAADDILLDDVIGGGGAAIVIENYPEAFKGPSVLVLQRDRDGKPMQIVRGIPKGVDGPATIITAYRPKPSRWSGDFMRRR